MQRLLRSGHAEGSPSSDRIRSPDSNGLLLSPLKQNLAAQKRNENLCLHFRLPLTERLMDAMEVQYTKESGKAVYQGRLYLSESFLSFESAERQRPPQQHLPMCLLVIPLYTVKRVERVNTGTYVAALAITVWHKMEHVFDLHASSSLRYAPFYLLIVDNRLIKYPQSDLASYSDNICGHKRPR